MIVYVIEVAAIKRFMLLDLSVGTVVYYVFEYLFSSVLLGIGGSFVITEAAKRVIR